MGVQQIEVVTSVLGVIAEHAGDKKKLNADQYNKVIEFADWIMSDIIEGTGTLSVQKVDASPENVQETNEEDKE